VRKDQRKREKVEKDGGLQQFLLQLNQHHWKRLKRKKSTTKMNMIYNVQHWKSIIKLTCISVLVLLALRSKADFLIPTKIFKESNTRRGIIVIW